MFDLLRNLFLNRWLFVVEYSSLTLAGLFSISGFAGPSPVQAPFFIEKAADQEDWRFFMRAPPAWRASLWEHYSSQGKGLKDWHWTWRLGWIKACKTEQTPWCKKLANDALKDPALVVRAAAVQALGQGFEGTENSEIIKALADTYSREENLRKGQPLFIQEYILFSLRQIGGTTASGLAESLAKRNAKTRLYWSKLNLP
ncbi:MAG: hypothetical protein HYW48_05835 [Deltaproteobacteria bacterium]|nr:hypothetical protein [Deltaproteobacteria bacterium]